MSHGFYNSNNTAATLLFVTIPSVAQQSPSTMEVPAPVANLEQHWNAQNRDVRRRRSQAETGVPQGQPIFIDFAFRGSITLTGIWREILKLIRLSFPFF
jgi:hypothetical protein